MKPSVLSVANLRSWGVVLGVLVLYVVTARLGLLVALPPEKKATAVWVPSGLALAAVLLAGRRVWPGVWVGAFLANLWDYFTPANPFPLAAHLGVSAGIATGSTLQAVAGHILVRRWIGPGSPFARTPTAFLFAGVAVLACLIAATVGTVSLYLGGFAPAPALGFIWWTWWLGDTTGILTAGSFLLAWSRWPTAGAVPGRAWEAGVLAVLLVALGLFVFGLGPAVIQLPAPLAYLTVPLLVWAAYRFGLWGATAAHAVVSGLAVLGTSLGTGPFAQPSATDALELLQVYMGVVSVTALVMAAMFNERQRAEAQAETSEGRYRLLLEGVPQLVWTCRPDGWCDYLSRQWVEYTGIPEADQLGYAWSDAVHPDDRALLLERWQQAVRTGDPLDAEFRIRGAGGGYRWFQTRAVKYRPDGGEPKWFGTNTDIHDRRMAEGQLREWTATLEQKVDARTAELRASQDRFRAIFHSQFQFIGLMSPDGTLLEANRTALAAAGVPEESVLGRRFWETAWWAHDAPQQERLKAAVGRAAGGEQDRFEASHPTADGQLMWVDFSLSPFRNESGEVVLLIPEGRDITARKRVEAALRLSEERFRAFMDHLPLAAWVADERGRLTLANRVLGDMLNRRPEDVIGKTRHDLLAPADARAHEANDRRVRESGAALELEESFLRPDGTTGFALSVKFPVPSADGSTAVGGVALDVTDRRRAEEQVRASLREKEVLLKEIHHRVKNNLQIVSSLLDLQSEHTDDPRALAMFQESRGRVRSMAHIHERLYRSQDLARVNVGEYVRQLADDLYRAYKVSDDDIRLEVDVDIPSLPLDVAIPCGLLLNELMSNCFKHAFAGRQTGCLSVSLRRHADGTDVLTVADDGAGFPPGTDFRTTTSFGLQLVNTLVEQLGGRVQLATGVGSTVTVRFATINR